jgi:hypothetical protein
MAGMRSRLAIALLAALAIEAANLRFLAPPIDVGYPPGTPWYVSLIGFQWVILHYPGLISLDWFERAVGCHQNNVVMGCSRTDMVVLFASGYLDTALLFVAMMVGFSLIANLAGRRGHQAQ